MSYKTDMNKFKVVVYVVRKISSNWRCKKCEMLLQSLFYLSVQKYDTTSLSTHCMSWFFRVGSSETTKKLKNPRKCQQNWRTLCCCFSQLLSPVIFLSAWRKKKQCEIVLRNNLLFSLKVRKDFFFLLKFYQITFWSRLLIFLVGIPQTNRVR